MGPVSGPTWLFLGIFSLCLLVVAAVIAAFGWALWSNRKERREGQSRGFEVKLNTGEEPVIEKKENDHG